MAATPGQYNGTGIGLYCAGTLLAYATSHTLNVNVATIDVTNKDSVGWTDILPGLRDWSIDVDGFLAFDSTTNAEYLYTLVSARTRVMVKLSGAVSGDDYWHGYCYISSFTLTAPLEDGVTFSASLAGDGALTKSTKT